MALKCPHIIWRVSPFNTTKYCVTDSFEYAGYNWQWEYYVKSDDDSEVLGEIVSVYLRRLTHASTCPLKIFSTIVSIRDSLGEQHAVRVKNHEISTLVSWCVWKKAKSYIIAHDVVENNGCAFSLTLEPFDHVEYMNSLSKYDVYNDSCLQELSRDFYRFSTSPRHADIILRCGNTEIKAHKDVLCFRSKKFSDMIEAQGGLEKNSTENLNVLTLRCMDPVVFINLIRYIYTATVPELTNELAKKIYEAADEYSIESLKKRCAKFMIQHLSGVNALKALIFASEHNDDDMKWVVSSFIANDMNILNSDEWKIFSSNNQTLAIEVFRIFTERVNNRACSEFHLS